VLGLAALGPTYGAVSFARTRRSRDIEATLGGKTMEIDTDRIDEAVLALLHLDLHDHYRTWKTFDWSAMDRLHAKGFISNPPSKAKSVVLTDEGIRESERLFRELFGVRR
jgi:hypothetical protein